MVLNTIYKKFKDKKGLDVTPRYSEKVTSYIYYQQGRDSDRGSVLASDLFDATDLVHFKADATGEEQDYHLEIPIIEEKEVVEEEVEKIEEKKVEEKKESWWPMSFIRDKYNALRENINIYNAGLLLGVAGTVGIAAGYYVYKTWLKK